MPCRVRQTAACCTGAGPEQKREHLHAIWREVVGGRPAVLLGTSLGGTVAMDFALHYPEAVDKLVLAAPQVGGHCPAGLVLGAWEGSLKPWPGCPGSCSLACMIPSSVWRDELALPCEEGLAVRRSSPLVPPFTSHGMPVAVQGFIDGLGMLPKLPRFFQEIGVKVRAQCAGTGWEGQTRRHKGLHYLLLQECGCHGDVGAFAARRSYHACQMRSWPCTTLH
jgi:pimeloyl-ACP methyl ester carboxylesterase